MLTQQLIQELKTIIKNETGLDLEDQVVEAVGEQLVSSYEVLIRLDNSNKP